MGWWVKKKSNVLPTNKYTWAVLCATALSEVSEVEQETPNLARVGIVHSGIILSTESLPRTHTSARHVRILPHNYT